MKIRTIIGAAVVLAPMALSVPTQAAGIPVIDAANLAQAVKEVEQMGQMVTQAIAQVHALTNIPQNMVGQVAGLLEGGIQNPLGEIMGNLTTLQTGVGTGTCTGSANILAMNQYQPATGGDFAGSMLNGSASRLAGLQACTNTMMEAQQQRIQQLPQLLDTLQGCGDVTCAQTVSARLQYENSVETAQSNQIALMGFNAQTQQWTVESQTLQKRRADLEQLVNLSGGNKNVGIGAPIAGGLPPIPPTEAPLFGAGG